MDYERLLFGLGITMFAVLAFRFIYYKYKKDLEFYESKSVDGSYEESNFKYTEVGRLVALLIPILIGLWIIYNSLARQFNWPMLPEVFF